MPYIVSCVVGLVSWLSWYLLLGPSPRESTLFVGFMPSTPGVWIESFLIAVKASVVDLDAIGAAPLLLCGGMVMAVFAGRHMTRRWAKEPFLVFVLLSVLVQVVLTSALLGTESAAHYSFVRYLPHLVVFTLLAEFVLLGNLIRHPALHLVVCAAVVLFNVASLSYWVQPSGRTVPFSWAHAVYSEILWPEDASWDEAVKRLRAESHNTETLMLGLPAWTQGILLFYVGDTYLVRPILSAPTEGITTALKAVLGESAANRLSGEPEWLVDSLSLLRAAPPGYTEVVSIPSRRTRPDDGARPELTRHSFAQAEPAKSIRLFHLQPTGQ